jgi:hypothetical protein
MKCLRSSKILMYHVLNMFHYTLQLKHHHHFPLEDVDESNNTKIFTRNTERESWITQVSFKLHFFSNVCSTLWLRVEKKFNPKIIIVSLSLRWLEYRILNWSDKIFFVHSQYKMLLYGLYNCVSKNIHKLTVFTDNVLEQIVIYNNYQFHNIMKWNYLKYRVIQIIVIYCNITIGKTFNFKAINSHFE